MNIGCITRAVAIVVVIGLFGPAVNAQGTQTPAPAAQPEAAKAQGRATGAGGAATPSVGGSKSDAGGASSTATDKLAEVWALEDQARLRDALTRLERPDLAQAATPHMDVLRSVLRAKETADVYLEERRYRRALTELNKLLPQLDPTRDRHLIPAVTRLRDSFESNVRKADEQEAREQLGQARAYREAKKYKEATAAYDLIINRKPEDVPISEDLIQQAKEGRFKTTTDEIRAQNPGWWDVLMKGLAQLLQWAFYFLVIGALIGLLTWLPTLLKPMKGIGLELRDTTVPADRQQEKSHNLMQESFTVIRDLIRTTDTPAVLDRLSDIDGTSLGNVRIDDTDRDEQMESLIQEASQVQIGPVSIPARQLFLMLRPFFNRPYEYSLTGTLSTSGDQTVLSVEGVPRRWILPNPRAHNWWAAAVPTKEGAREQVLREVMMHVAVDLTRPVSTDNWESIRSYHSAVSRLDTERTAADRIGLLRAALVDLEDSVRYDPSNFLAWFTLATVLRKLGNNGAAAQHFDLLSKMIGGSDESSLLGKYVAKHSEFPGIVVYNHASALAKTDNWEDYKMASDLLIDLLRQLNQCSTSDRRGPAPDLGKMQYNALLDKVTKLMSSKPRPTVVRTNIQCPTQRMRLEVLALSALASAMVFELERPSEYPLSQPRKLGKTPDARKTRQDQVFSAIQDIFQCLEDRRSASKARLDWQTYNLALVVVLNAVGRASYLRGEYRKALKYLRRAVNMMPDVDFIDVKINLAALYLRCKDRAHPSWFSQAESQLLAALKITPTNQKARYLLAKLYCDPGIGRYQEAKKYLSEADPDPWIDRLLAEILARHDNPPDFKEAVRRLRSSIALFPRPDHRYVDYLDYALQFVGRERADPNFKPAPQFIKDLKFVFLRGRNSPNLPNPCQKRIAELWDLLHQALGDVILTKTDDRSDLAATPAPSDRPGPDSTAFRPEPESADPGHQGTSQVVSKAPAADHAGPVAPPPVDGHATPAASADRPEQPKGPSEPAEAPTGSLAPRDEPAKVAPNS
jgi:tetratricopeptide (TPR) repeat protein